MRNERTAHPTRTASERMSDTTAGERHSAQVRPPPPPEEESVWPTSHVAQRTPANPRLHPSSFAV